MQPLEAPARQAAATVTVQKDVNDGDDPPLLPIGHPKVLPQAFDNCRSNRRLEIGLALSTETLKKAFSSCTSCFCFFSITNLHHLYTSQTHYILARALYIRSNRSY